MIQRLTYGSSYCAIEHSTDYHKNDVFYGLELVKKKQALVVKEKHRFTDFTDLLHSEFSKNPLFLIINNAQVLSKKVDEVHSNPLKITQQAFPTIKLSDFYIEIIHNKTTSFVSICRKEYVDKLIKDYKKNNTAIIHFSLGNATIQYLLPFITDAKTTSTNATISIKNHQLIDIQKSNNSSKEYLINELPISNNEVLSLGGILALVTQQKNTQTNFLDKQVQLQKSFQQNSIFKIGYKTALGILLTILLINFFVFNHYRTKVGTLTNEVSLNETYKKQLVQLNERVRKKKRLAESIQSVAGIKVSKYIDQIGRTVPNMVLLSELYYQPISGQLKKEKVISYKKNQILVKGISKNDTYFTDWIALLEKKDWVKKVTILNYGSGKKKTASFEFLIQLKDD